ncbi:hypothetical protein [Nocardia sp. NPDC058633]|uniref:hypothetical protein n=1 Tax=Nocardia sp. NPDC058633 TaxID=3346568 RepID=UPI0036548399
MGRAIHVSELQTLIEYRRADVIDARIKDNADLQCVAEPRFGSRSPSDATATDSDYHRWRSATEELLASIRVLQDRARQVGLHLHPPLGGSALSRRWWHVRYARRNRLLRANYDPQAAALRAQFDRALTAYLARAGDLPAFLSEYRVQQQQRAQQEWQRRKEETEREEARARSRRAEALNAATGPQWAFKISDYAGSRSFWILLSSLDEGRADRTGLTVAEVHAALVAERAQYPYTGIIWGTETGRALEEQHRSKAAGWEALTGELIDPHPLDPSRPQRSTRYGGPSSTYGSDGGGGFSGGFGGYR